MTSIGDRAFAECKYIENVYCYAEEVPWTGSYAFDDSNIEMLHFTSLHLQSRLIKQQSLGATLELLKLSKSPMVLNQ